MRLRPSSSCLRPAHPPAYQSRSAVRPPFVSTFTSHATSSDGGKRGSTARDSPSASSSNSKFPGNSSNSHELGTPRDLTNHLSKYIIGQDKAKKILSVAVYNHYHRIIDAYRQRQRELARLRELEQVHNLQDVELDVEEPGRSRSPSSRTSASRDHDDRYDDVDELIRVERQEPDPTLVHKGTSWDALQGKYSDLSWRQTSSGSRSKVSPAVEDAEIDHHAPPTLLGRVRNAFGALKEMETTELLSDGLRTRRRAVSKISSKSEKVASEVEGAEELEDVIIEKSNVLMIGPTGSGKTLLARTLAKAIGVPFATSDATSFTQAGYVGEDVESCVARLLKEADYDVARAETGIIHIDECDKLARRGGSAEGGGFGGRDVGGEGVQQGLLKLLEGTVVNIQAKAPAHLSPSSHHHSAATVDPSEPHLPRGLGIPPFSELSSKKGIREGLPAHGTSAAVAANSKGETYSVDTSNILFILSGAFVGLDKIVGRRSKQGSIGFNAVLPERQVDDAESHEGDIGKKTDLLEGLVTTDLVNYGFIPEFVGRLPVVATLHPLSFEDLVRILVEPKNALIKQYRKRYASWDCDLRFSLTALHEIARQASKKGGSARHLRSILEQLLLDSMYEIPGSSVRYAAVTSAVVRGEVPVWYFSRGQKETFIRTLRRDDGPAEEAEAEIEDEERLAAFA